MQGLLSCGWCGKVRTSENAYSVQPGDLLQMDADTHVPLVASQKSYRVISRSKRTSVAPSPRTAWNASSASFVFWDLHAGAFESLQVRREAALVLDPISDLGAGDAGTLRDGLLH